METRWWRSPTTSMALQWGGMSPRDLSVDFNALGRGRKSCSFEGKPHYNEGSQFSKLKQSSNGSGTVRILYVQSCWWAPLFTFPPLLPAHWYHRQEQGQGHTPAPGETEAESGPHTCPNTPTRDTAVPLRPSYVALTWTHPTGATSIPSHTITTVMTDTYLEDPPDYAPLPPASSFTRPQIKPTQETSRLHLTTSATPLVQPQLEPTQETTEPCSAILGHKANMDLTRTHPRDLRTTSWELQHWDTPARAFLASSQLSKTPRHTQSTQGVFLHEVTHSRLGKIALSPDPEKQHRKSNKMRKQRNTLETKERDKTSEKELN